MRATGTLRKSCGYALANLANGSPNVFNIIIVFVSGGDKFLGGKQIQVFRMIWLGSSFSFRKRLRLIADIIPKLLFQ